MATKKTAKDTTKAAVSYPVLNMSGKEVGSIELDGTIFASKIVESIVFDAVMWQLSKRRQGTHSVLTKGNMKGGGQKPWKQKGTGRARAGTNRSPLWVGGGVAHGPKSNPFGYELRVTKRSRRQALASALTDKVSQKSLVILDSLAIPSGKTKDMEKVLSALGVNGKKVGLLVPNEMACAPKRGACRKAAQSPELKAARNLKNIELFPVSGLNVWDVLKANVLVGDRSQFIALQEELRARGAEDAQATSGK